ncbi:hypothetical protein M3D01_004080 [Micrococcus luteus]|nr:hypothetical protein [Micrococcus luteus]
MNENTKTDVQTIENASLDDVRPGDHLTWEYAREVGGVTISVRREGVAAGRYGSADWYTKAGMWITEVGFAGSLTIRRPALKGGTAWLTSNGSAPCPPAHGRA